MQTKIEDPTVCNPPSPRTNAKTFTINTWFISNLEKNQQLRGKYMVDYILLLGLNWDFELSEYRKILKTFSPLADPPPPPS